MVHDTGYWIGIFIGGFLVGGLCGIAPLIAGSAKNQQTLGYVGLATCVVSGLILGLILAAPVALVFTLVILLRRTEA